ncbi:MAG: DUF4325 domain-containing protein, partial [Patescibacteria group bacterium]
MITKEDIMEIGRKMGVFKTVDVVSRTGVSRQFASFFLKRLVDEGVLIKFGSTRNSSYCTNEYVKNHANELVHRIKKTYDNVGLEEHAVQEDIERVIPFGVRVRENIKSIFDYAFSEMCNNAIEHSQAKKIDVSVSLDNKMLSFVIQDSGIGVFRNVMKKRELDSELYAAQDLMKGKTTTMPQSHSGEGIFFTSKVGMRFELDSYGHRLIVNNTDHTVVFEAVKHKIHGTKVVVSIAADSGLHLSDIFREFTNIGEDSDYGFDKTEIRVQLFTRGGVHVSRSQARRVLSGLEKFKVVVFDFENVSMVGQAFADEIFRVFHNKFPDIRLETENMNEAVAFMVGRV